MTQGYKQPRSVSARFWEKVDCSGECWIWTAAKGPRGYGSFMVGSRIDGSRRILAAHRVAYWLTHGVWSTVDRHLHHRCLNPSCVRPDHLEIIGPRDHIYQHDGPTAKNGRLTNCRKCGRPLAGENLLFETGRRCRECRRQSLNASKRQRTRERGPTTRQIATNERNARIILLRESGLTLAVIADHEGLSVTTIHRVVQRKGKT